MFGNSYRQILSLASPPIEVLAPKMAVELSQLGNDGMADLVAKYPERFPGFIASLPMNNIDAAIVEVQRAIEQLGARGIQLYTNVAGRPLDEPELLPLFDLMADYDLPICLHPSRTANFSDYQSEDKSKYEIWWTFGWPYETSVAMARMVFSQLLGRLPNLKVLTHHMGAMIPYFVGRIGPGWDQLGTRTSDEDYTTLLKKLNKRPFDYFKQFYADTALFGAYAATVCGLDFFGEDKVLFASDAPFDPEGGYMYIRETIKVIDSLDISQEQRAKIYERNAQKLFKLE